MSEDSPVTRNGDQFASARSREFQSESSHASVSSLAGLIASDEPGGLARWTAATEDLHVNLIQLPEDRPIAEHVNSEVDVLILVLEGYGEITIDDEKFVVTRHDVSIIRKGTRRSLRATSTSMSYITCHRRRGAIRPRPKASASDAADV